MLFVDEIHRLNRAVEEILYPALEDFRLDIVVGQGPAARTLTLDLRSHARRRDHAHRTAATPLRDRFGLPFRLDSYAPEDLGAHPPALGAYPRRRGRPMRRPCSRGARARHAPGRQPHPAARAGRRRGPSQRHGHAPEIAQEALKLLEIDGARPRADGPRAPARGSSSAVSTAARSASRPSRWPWARNRTRSRTSTSRTCSSSAFCSGRRAGGSSRLGRARASRCGWRPRTASLL